MNTKEKNFSNTLKKYFLQEKFFVDKIESRATTTGIPDLLVLSPNGTEQFIELKVVEADNKISLTPGQISWHSRRLLRHRTHPFVVLYEPTNSMLVMSSRKVLDIVKDKGGKIQLDDVPPECWFKRNAVDYALLIYTAADLYFTSSRVYK